MEDLDTAVPGPGPSQLRAGWGRGFPSSRKTGALRQGLGRRLRRTERARAPHTSLEAHIGAMEAQEERGIGVYVCLCVHARARACAFLRSGV